MRARWARMYSTAGMKREVRNVFGHALGALLGEQIDALAARQIVERRGRFGAEDEAERVGRKLRQRHRLELRARGAQHVERVLQQLVALLGAAPRVLRISAAASAAAASESAGRG